MRHEKNIRLCLFIFHILYHVVFVQFKLIHFEFARRIYQKKSTQKIDFVIENENIIFNIFEIMKRDFF